MIRIAKKTITFILSLILFFLICFMTFILSCKTLITKENLSDYVKSIDVLNVDLGIIFNLEEKGITLKEKIYDLAIESKIPEPIINDILKSDEINNILGDFFKSTIDYVLKGDTKPNISKETKEKMIDISFISLENHMNIMISEEELEVYVIDYCSKLVDIVPERNLIIGYYTMDRINQIVYFDITNIIILIVIDIILICVINKSIYKVFRYLGSTMILSGLIFVVIGCLNNLISAYIIGKYSTLENFILPLVTNVLTIVFKNGVLLSFTGIFIYLTYIIANRIKLNSKINELLSKQ